MYALDFLCFSLDCYVEEVSTAIFSGFALKLCNSVRFSLIFRGLSQFICALLSYFYSEIS